MRYYVRRLAFSVSGALGVPLRRRRAEALQQRLFSALPKHIKPVLLLGGEYRIKGLQSFIKQCNVFDLLIALDCPDSRDHVVNGCARLGLLGRIQF